MSEVNLQFTVNSYSATFEATTNDLQFNPTSTQLSIYTGYTTFAPGGTYDKQVIFNSGDSLVGSNNLTYTSSTEKLTTANLKVNGQTELGAVNNVKITGGTSGYFLRTDGTGNLTFAKVGAGGNVTEIQFNSGGNLDGIPTANYSGGKFNLGSTSDVKLLGGTNGYVLQTDGVGNLTWTAQTGGSGTGSPGGANTQVQFNDAGVFGAVTGFTYDKNSSTLTTPKLTVSSDALVQGDLAVTSNAAVGSLLTDNLKHSDGSPWDFVTPPSGSTGYVQFNNAGSFGSNSYFKYTVANSTLQSNSIAITNTATITGNLAVSGNSQFTNTISIQQAKEKVTIDAATYTGNVTFDVLSQAVLYLTHTLTGNLVVNVRGNASTTLNDMMSVGESTTFTLVTSVGTTQYMPTTFKIDSNTVVPLWVGNLAPSTSTIFSNSVSCYNFTAIKVGANSYTVLGSYAGFK